MAACGEYGGVPWHRCPSAPAVRTAVLAGACEAVSSLLSSFLSSLLRCCCSMEGATLSGRQCAYKIVEDVPALAAAAAQRRQQQQQQPVAA